MVEVAVLGYGTVGAGVVNVLMTNAASIEKSRNFRPCKICFRFTRFSRYTCRRYRNTRF